MLLYAILYLSHPPTSAQNFTEIVPGEPFRRGLNAIGVVKYTDFWTSRRYIHIGKIMQDTASVYGTTND